MTRRARRWLGALVAALALVGAGGIALAHGDAWLFELLDPGPFDPADTPAAPDYSEDAAWAALPSMDDAADVALPALPAVNQEAAPADVFYLHPTTWLGTRWNAPFDDPAVVEATARGGTLIQASAFNGCCAVYAPRYRQANGKAFVDPSPEGRRAVDVAYADVEAAFEAFLARTAGRPFVLASHSQGTVLAVRLLRERILGREPQARLVAAYLVGGPVTAGTFGAALPVCTSEAQTGCFVAYNARGPRHRGSRFDFVVPAADPGAPLSETARAPADRLAGRVCVNPLSWRADEVPASAERHAGALFLDSEHPELLPRFTAATCRDGRLVLTGLGELPARDFMSGLLLWMMGPDDFHPIEYQLFWVNLRENARARVAAFLRKDARTGASPAEAAEPEVPAQTGEGRPASATGELDG